MPVPRMSRCIVSFRRGNGWTRRVGALLLQDLGFLRATQGHHSHRLCPDEHCSNARPRSVLIALPLCTTELKRLAMDLDSVLLAVLLGVFRHRGALHCDGDRQECCDSKHWGCLGAKDSHERRHRNTMSLWSPVRARAASIGRAVPRPDRAATTRAAKIDRIPYGALRIPSLSARFTSKAASSGNRKRLATRSSAAFLNAAR
jgi:hypothetical protein